jgi:excisionase family DNA binding protein
LLAAPEVAELLGVSARYVLELARRGEIAHVRIGRSVRFRRESVEAFVIEREQGSRARFRVGLVRTAGTK